MDSPLTTAVANGDAEQITETIPTLEDALVIYSGDHIDSIVERRATFARPGAVMMTSTGANDPLHCVMFHLHF